MQPTLKQFKQHQTPPAFVEEQTMFARKLLWHEDGLPPGITSHSSPAPVKRFNVYRNNVFASLTETLVARFPVVERLVGEEFFQAMAREFIPRQPPRSAMLLAYGSTFPAFLEAFEPVASLAYLPDVARLEWACNAAYHAADAAPMEGAALAAIPPDAMGGAVLHLHPSVRTVASPYPIVSIWETNTYDKQVRPIGPEMPGETALVVRQALDVLVLRLDRGAAAFVASISAGHPLSVAVESAFQADAGFSLPTTLAALLEAGVLTGFSLKSPN
ncbi:MAG: DNA-binding domain-containing protein [Alphaproteobacteria bacterium]